MKLRGIWKPNLVTFSPEKLSSISLVEIPEPHRKISRISQARFSTRIKTILDISQQFTQIIQPRHRSGVVASAVYGFPNSGRRLSHEIARAISPPPRLFLLLFFFSFSHPSFVQNLFELIESLLRLFKSKWFIQIHSKVSRLRIPKNGLSSTSMNLPQNHLATMMLISRS